MYLHAKINHRGEYTRYSYYWSETDYNLDCDAINSILAFFITSYHDSHNHKLIRAVFLFPTTHVIYLYCSKRGYALQGQDML